MKVRGSLLGLSDWFVKYLVILGEISKYRELRPVYHFCGSYRQMLYPDRFFILALAPV